MLCICLKNVVDVSMDVSTRCTTLSFWTISTPVIGAACCSDKISSNTCQSKGRSNSSIIYMYILLAPGSAQCTLHSERYIRDLVDLRDLGRAWRVLVFFCVEVNGSFQGRRLKACTEVLETFHGITGSFCRSSGSFHGSRCEILLKMENFDACYDRGSTHFSPEMVSEWQGSSTQKKKKVIISVWFSFKYRGHGMFRPAAVIFCLQVSFWERS